MYLSILKNAKGLSLVEITIAMVIGLFIALGAGYLIFQTRKVNQTATIGNELDRAHLVLLQRARSTTFMSRELGLIDARGEPIRSPRNDQLLSCLSKAPLPGVDCSDFSTEGNVVIPQRDFGQGGFTEQLVIKHKNLASLLISKAYGQAGTQYPTSTSTTNRDDPTAGSTSQYLSANTTTDTTMQSTTSTTNYPTQQQGGSDNNPEPNNADHCANEHCTIKAGFNWELRCNAQGCQEITITAETSSLSANNNTSKRITELSIPGYLVGQRFDLNLDCSTSLILTGIDHKAQKGICEGISGNSRCDTTRPINSFAVSTEICQPPLNYQCSSAGFKEFSLSSRVCSTTNVAPPCPPVNCVMSNWSYSNYSWTDPVNSCGEQKRTANRTITTESSCGGTPCGALTMEEPHPTEPTKSCGGTPVDCVLGPEQLISTTFSDPTNFCGTKTDKFETPVITPAVNGGTCPNNLVRETISEVLCPAKQCDQPSYVSFSAVNTQPSSCDGGRWSDFWINNSRDHVNNLTGLAPTSATAFNNSLNTFINWIEANGGNLGEEFRMVNGSDGDLRWSFTFSKFSDGDVRQNPTNPGPEQECSVNAAISYCAGSPPTTLPPSAPATHKYLAVLQIDNGDDECNVFSEDAYNNRTCNSLRKVSNKADRSECQQNAVAAVLNDNPGYVLKSATWQGPVTTSCELMNVTSGDNAGFDGPNHLLTIEIEKMQNPTGPSSTGFCIDPSIPYLCPGNFAPSFYFNFNL